MRHASRPATPWVALLATVALARVGRAQDIDEDDPLGGALDDSRERIVEVRRGSPVAPVEGAVLTAIPGVRVTRHEVAVELVAGLALIHERLDLESNAHQVAEAWLRLPVDGSARLASLRVCRESACREGVPTSEPSAYDHAVLSRRPAAAAVPPIARIRAASGLVTVEVAPLEAGGIGTDGRPHPGTLRVELGYSVPLETFGGVARVTLPSLPADLRTVPRQVTLLARDLSAPRIDGVELDPGTSRAVPSGAAIEVTAEVPASAQGELELWRVPCPDGRSRCAWGRAMAAATSVTPRHVTLFLDSSPSARSNPRVRETALALLGALPEDAEVQVVSLGARWERQTTGYVALASAREAVLRGSDLDLGPMTRIDLLLDASLPLEHVAGERRVWVGDGGWTQVSSDLARLQRTDIVFIHTRVPDPGFATALTQAARPQHVIPTNASDEALRGGLRSILAGGAPTVIRWGPERLSLPPGSAIAGPLPPGRSRSVALEPSERLAQALRHRFADTAVLAATDRSAPLTCGDDAPSASESLGVHTSDAPIVPAHGRSCASSPSPSPSPSPHRTAGLPSETLLRSLRQRVLPRARDCLRSDRRGRPAYSTRFVVELRLADRELAEVRIDGSIASELRACAVRATEAVEIPAFDGVIIARWPLHTLAEDTPPPIELSSTLSDAIDQLAPRVPVPTHPF